MKLRLDIFEGPLDLLIYLIKKEHLNVYDIPIANVVGQYLKYLELMELLDINIAAEYLLMTANLINIKSKMLLPKPAGQEEPEEDPRDKLVKKLLEYEKFKEAAGFLRDKEVERNKYFNRPSNDPENLDVYIEASIFDLISAFESALKDVPKDIFFEVVKDEFTVEEKIHDLLHLLLIKEKVSLDELFSSAKSKLEIVVTFLGILELIKMKELVAIQDELFGSILIARREIVYTSL